MKIDDFFLSSKIFDTFQVTSISKLEYEFKKKCFCEFSNISAIACSLNFDTIDLDKNIKFISQIKFNDIDVILNYDLINVFPCNTAETLYTFKLKKCTYF